MIAPSAVRRAYLKQHLHQHPLFWEEFLPWNYTVDKVFEYTKAPYELCVRENLKQAVLNMGVILDCKDIQLIPSAKYRGCFRVRPALTEEQVNMVKNYLDTYMEV